MDDFNPQPHHQPMGFGGVLCDFTVGPSLCKGDTHALLPPLFMPDADLQCATLPFTPSLLPPTFPSISMNSTMNLHTRDTTFETQRSSSTNTDIPTNRINGFQTS